MCNRFNTPTSVKAICEALRAQPVFDFELPGEVFPKSVAPAMVLSPDGLREIRPMTFGLVPHGKTPPYPLNNTRIESRDKWPWKSPFEKHRCIVPMSSFREPCYWGSMAGKEVNFSAADGELLLAAAIFSTANATGDQSAWSMSLVMRPGLPYVMEHGHHRSPFLLRAEGVDDWMNPESRSSDESLEILREHAAEPNLQVDVARDMAASWTKRQKGNVKKRDEQLAEIDTVGPLGF